MTLASATFSWAQEKCEAFIDWQYVQPVDVYSAPGGKIIGQIRNDTVAEDLIGLEILDSRKSFVRVKATMLVSGKTQTGWIKKADYIGAYYREERTPTMDLTLFTDPSTKNPIVIQSWTPGVLAIEKCKGEWVLVSTACDGKKIVGWIRSIDLCANPYTTCN